MNECVNVWMDWWMDEWMDDRMDEWMADYRLTDEWMNEWMDEWMNGWTNWWAFPLLLFRPWSSCSSVVPTSKPRTTTANRRCTWWRGVAGSAAWLGFSPRARMSILGAMPAQHRCTQQLRWVQRVHVNTAEIRFSAVRSPRFWVSSYSTKWRIQGSFHSSSSRSSRLVYTHDVSTSTSTSISHVWTGTIHAQAQARVPFSCLCLRFPGSHVAYACACAYVWYWDLQKFNSLMNLSPHKLCTRKTEVALEIKFHRDLLWVLTVGSVTSRWLGKVSLRSFRRNEGRTR